MQNENTQLTKQPDIPKFYYPYGRPKDQEQVKAVEETIEKIFSEKIELKKEDFEQITTEVCGIPKFFKNMLFDRIDSGKTLKITKPHFLQFWRRDYQNADIHRRLFKLIAKTETPDYII